MSVLLDKSNENIRVADLLINQHHCYAASVHCSYYSVFQRSVHILKQQFGMTDKEIDLDAAFNGQGKDSHKRTIAVMYEKIDRANKRLKAVDYRREMEQLKGKHHKADYKEDVINESFSQDAYRQAQTIQQLLDNVFPLS